MKARSALLLGAPTKQVGHGGAGPLFWLMRESLLVELVMQVGHGGAGPLFWLMRESLLVELVMQVGHGGAGPLFWLNTR
jgi:hypothetical protein